MSLIGYGTKLAIEFGLQIYRSNVCKPFLQCVATTNISSWIDGIGTFNLAHLFSLHFGRFR